MSYQHTTATSAVLFFVVLVLIVVVPGALVGIALRLRPLAVVALAPVFTVTTITVGGILAAEAGIDWDPPVFAACTALAVGVAFVVGRTVNRRSRPRRRPWTRNQSVGALAGGLVGAATVAVSFRLAFGSPRSVPAQPDAAYHLNQIRHMLQTHDISSLTASGLLYDHAAGFYPAGWHGLAVTALQLVPIELPIASNTLALVTGAIIWTSGCILLARQAFGAHGAALGFAGVLSASFTAMPYLLSGYGVLWPNLLGMALVPSVLACLLSIAGLARDDLLGRPVAVVATIFALPGLFFAHPNGVAALVLLGFAILLLEGPRWAVEHRRRRPILAVTIVVALASTPLLWWATLQIPRVHNLRRFYDHPPDESVARAVSETVLGNPRYGAPLWIAGALVLIGLVRALLRRRDQWQVAVWLAAALVFVGVAGFQNGLSRAVTGVWYNNSPRLAAILPVGTVILATSGLLVVTHWAHLLVLRFADRWRPALAVAPALAVVVSAALVAAYVVGTGGNYVREHRDRLGPYIHPYRAHNLLLTSRGYAALLALRRSIPPDALVADNPWRGTSLLYALTGRRVLYNSEKAVNTADRYRIATALYLAGLPAFPDICAAVRRAGVTYVITGGTNFLPDRQSITRFPGIDQVPGEPGFELVRTVEPYALWKITACAP
jgi:hypothetical protein